MKNNGRTQVRLPLYRGALSLILSHRQVSCNGGSQGRKREVIASNLSDATHGTSLTVHLWHCLVDVVVITVGGNQDESNGRRRVRKKMTARMDHSNISRFDRIHGTNSSSIRSSRADQRIGSKIPN